MIRPQGNTGFSLSAIGIGTAAIGGGGYAWGWGPQDDRDSIAAIRAAVEAGINWIDTAGAYGLGRAEEVIARAIDGLSPRPYVFTKCGVVWDESRKIWHCLKKDSIRREIEASLRRLRTDTIDLYQIHFAEPDADIEEAWDTLIRLQAEGKARRIGVCNFDTDQMNRVRSFAPIATLQMPYSLLARQAEVSTLPYSVEHKIAFLAYSPMKSGLLSGAMTRERIATLPVDDFRRTHPDFSGPRLSRHLKLVEFLRQLGKHYDCSAAEVAIAWVLNNPAVTGAIVGMRSAAQVPRLVSAIGIQLSPADTKALDLFLTRLRPGLLEKVARTTKRLVRRIVRE